MRRKLLLKGALASFLLLVANAQWAFIYANYDRLQEVEAVRAQTPVDTQAQYVAAFSGSVSAVVFGAARGGREAPVRVALPFISKSAPVRAASDNPDAQLDEGAVVYWTRGGEDRFSSPIIVGHSSAAVRSPYMHLFTQIPKMRPGNVVGLEYSGSVATYEYVGGKVVAPGAVDDLPGGYGRAYLVTCYPFLTSLSRYVVELRRVGEYAVPSPVPAR